MYSQLESAYLHKLLHTPGLGESTLEGIYKTVMCPLLTAQKLGSASQELVQCQTYPAFPERDIIIICFVSHPTMFIRRKTCIANGRTSFISLPSSLKGNLEVFTQCVDVRRAFLTSHVTIW